MSSNGYDQQLVVVLSSAVRSSPIDAVVAILSAESFAKEVNHLGPLGSSALHLAAWRNHRGIVKAILAAKNVDVNGQDEESGWTALHRALYFGHVRVASVLMAAGADGNVQDHQGRRAVDLISRVLVRNGAVYRTDGQGDSLDSYAGDKTTGMTSSDGSVVPYGHVFSWGNGSNYTLGTGSLEVELAPSRVDALHMHDVQQVGAAKFHSAAVTVDGKLFTWGWGRGGRLGHPEKNIHSGNSAVIHPRLVASLFSSGKIVRKVAVAKHHTLVTTAEGELFSMGGNRHGQLGHGRETAALKYVAEPKKIMALRSCFITEIAAANKHSVAVTSTGEVYTWGSNTCGQLGYGAFDSNSFPMPRVVDAMKGKFVVACAAAKRHTVVLTNDGDVLTWGHRGVSPRKVNLTSVRKSSFLDGTPLRFQKGYKDVLKPQVERICAGAAHTSVLTTAGVVLTWRSADPQCQVQELGGLLSGERVIDISAGKYRTAAVTVIGTVCMWEGRADYNPAECRAAGSGSKKLQSMNENDRVDVSHMSAGRSIHMMGSSMDSMSSFDGSHLGSSPGSLSHRFGSPSMMERMHSRFKSVGLAAHSPSPSGGSFHSLKGSHLGAGAVPRQQQAFERIYPVLVDGLRRITRVAVGEKHSVALQSWMRSGDDYFSSELVDDEEGVEVCAYTTGPSSLQVQCEEAIAKHMVDPHTVLQVMMYAEAAGADMLYRRCCCVAALNLDIVITEHPQIFAEMPPNLLHDIELELARIMGRGSSLLRSAKNTGRDDFVFLTPTCPANLSMRCPSRSDPALGDAHGKYAAPPDAMDVGLDPSMVEVSSPRLPGDLSDPYFDESRAGSPSIGATTSPERELADGSDEILKLQRLIMKKLEQIHALEEKIRTGVKLDPQQTAKLGQKGVIISALAALEGGVPHEEVNALLRAASQAVVESQRNQSSEGWDGHADARESRESFSRHRDNRAPHGPAQQEDGRKLAHQSSSKPKAKTKPKRKPKNNNKADLGSDSALSNHNGASARLSAAVGALTSSLRQASLEDGPSRSPKGSSKAGSSYVVGFEPRGSDFEALRSAKSTSSDPQHALSPIKTVGFRPSMDGRPGMAPGNGTAQTSAVAGGSSSIEMHPAHSVVTLNNKANNATSKAQTRKGGLTMFLRGELDGSAGNKPAWGGPAKLETPVSPLSKWFSSNTRPPKPENADRDAQGSNPKQTLGRMHQAEGSKPKKVSLAAFIDQVEAAPTKAWSSEKTAASSSKAIKSLRTIQDEQEELRAATRRITFARSPSAYAKVVASDAAPTSSFHAHSMGHSPRSSGTGFFGTSPHSGGKLFVASAGPSESRWYISEEQSMEAAKAKSLKDIQAEESAAKEIAEITKAFRDLEQRQQSASSNPPRRRPRQKARSKNPKKKA